MKHQSKVELTVEFGPDETIDTEVLDKVREAAVLLSDAFGLGDVQRFENAHGKGTIYTFVAE